MLTDALPIRVVGVGSPHGDDAVAWHVVKRLQSRCVQRWVDIELHACDGGQCLLDLLDGRGMLILVDAMSSGAPPGTVHRLQLPDQRLACLRPGSTHDMNPIDALRLANAIAIAPPQTIVYGIEIANAEPETRMHPSVARAIDEVVWQIEAELQQHAGATCALVQAVEFDRA